MDKSGKHVVFSMGNARHVNPKASNNQWIPIDYGLEIVVKQMKIAGNRPRVPLVVMIIFFGDIVNRTKFTM